MNKKSQKQKPKKLYLCFSCREKKPRSRIARSGRRRDGATWHVCRECHSAYKAEREMDKQAYRATVGDIRTGETGSESMGWNGVPSGKALRRRRS